MFYIDYIGLYFAVHRHTISQLRNEMIMSGRNASKFSTCYFNFASNNATSIYDIGQKYITRHKMNMKHVDFHIKKIWQIL